MPKMSKLMMEERSLKIRQLMATGLTQPQIQHTLGVDKMTMKSYMDRIYKEDAIMLSQKKERALASDIVLYKSRLEKALRDLNILLQDATTVTTDKIKIIQTIVTISDQLLKVDSEGTALLKLKPELQEYIDNAGAVVRNKIEINTYNINNRDDSNNNKRVIIPKDDEF